MPAQNFSKLLTILEQRNASSLPRTLTPPSQSVDSTTSRYKDQTGMWKACIMTRTVTHISICPLLLRSGRFLYTLFDSESENLGTLQGVYRFYETAFQDWVHREMHIIRTRGLRRVSVGLKK